MDRQCPACVADLECQREKEKRKLSQRAELIQLLGGEKPYQEFTFERYEITSGNRHAYEKAKQFNPAKENLYLWGPCGVGKTHLAYAIARTCFQGMLSVTVLLAAQISRKVRMKDPEKGQTAIDEFVRVEALVLEDMGTGPNTAFSRQLFQEILDAREFRCRAGLVVTSAYSLDALAAKLDDDTIASRLSGMCHVIEVGGGDHRLRKEHPEQNRGL